MIRDFETKKSDGRIIIDNYFFGFGFMVEFDPPYSFRKKKFSIRMDLIFIRIWWDFYKK